MTDPVGRIAALWRYPVKSMAAESLEAVDVSWHGLAGDRRWAFIRDGIVRSGFAWMTIRERGDMWHYRPRFQDPSRPDTSATLVATPSGAELDVIDPGLAAELGDGVRVIKQDRGVFDASPLSLITTQTVAALADMVDAELEPRRFRPNLLVQAADSAPFQEDDWVGEELRVGEMRMRVERRNQRCVVVDTNPATTARDAPLLKALGRERDACAGVYAATLAPGRVAVGDPVFLDG